MERVLGFGVRFVVCLRVVAMAMHPSPALAARQQRSLSDTLRGGCIAILAFALAVSAGDGAWWGGPRAAGAESLPAESVAAAEPASPAACPDATTACDVWVVSTRRLPGVCGVPSQADVDVEHLDAGCRCWQRVGLAELLADPLQPLVIFIHGNRYDAAAAREQGLRLASRLGGRACAPAVRTVIFSWPSDQQGVLVQDSRRKYRRAFSDGRYLAWLLGHLEPERPVALVGYSFGGLVALEALAAEPSLGSAWRDRPGRTHLVLVTPAVRCDALLPGGPYRRALDGVDRLELIINSRDRALRFFRFVDPALAADALGFVGMAASRLPVGLEFAAADAASIIGPDHSFRPYLDSRSLGGRIAGGAVDGLAD